MAAEGTQTSDRTDVQSQWVYNEMAGSLQRASFGHDTQQQSDSDRKTLHTGDRGYVNFNLAAYPSLGRTQSRPESNKSARSEQGEDQDEEEALSPVSESRTQTDRFPENERFQAPKTPAVNGKKRKLDILGESSPHMTAMIPANPFGSATVLSSGPMGLSQAFRNTQAPSSPLVDVLPSSDRPSPDFAHVRRLSATEVLPSSENLQSSSAMKGAMNSRQSWTDAQDGLRLVSTSSSPLPPESVEDLFEVLSNEEESRRHLQRKVKASRQRAQRELSRALIPTVMDESKLSDKRKRPNKAPLSKSSPVLRGYKMGVLPADDSGPASEAETEHEGAGSGSETHEDDMEELADENKENVAIEALPTNKLESQDRVTASTKGLRQAVEQRDDLSVPSSVEREQLSSLGSMLYGDRQQHQEKRNPKQQRLNTTIADSQRTQQDRRASNLYEASANSLKLQEDCSNVVQESQAFNVPDSSEPPKPATAPQTVRSPSSPLTSPPPTRSTQRNSSSLVPDYENNLNRYTSNSERVVSGMIAEKFGSSEGDVRPFAERITTSSHTPRPAALYPSTVPETVSTFRRPGQRRAQSMGEETPLASRKAATSRRFSRNTSQEQSNAQSANEHVGQVTAEASQSSDMSQPNKSPASPPSRSLMQITTARLTDKESQKVDLDFEIMNQDDKDFVEEIEKYSSPISSLRRKRMKPQRQSQANDQTKPNQPNSLVLAKETFQASSAPERVPAEDEKMRAKMKDLPRKESSPRGVFSDDVQADEPRSDGDSIANSKVANPDSERRPQPASSILEGGPTEDLKQQLLPRVFAYWSGRGLNYYPATCLEERTTEPMFKVRFDYDNTVTDVKSTRIKRLELVEGDHIRVDIDHFRSSVYIVEGCFDPAPEDEEWPEADVYGNRLVRVRLKTKDKKLEKTYEFPITSIYHGAQTWKLLKDRNLTSREDEVVLGDINVGQIGQAHTTFPHLTPASQRRKFLADLLKLIPTATSQKITAKANRPGIFTGMVFVLTNINESSRGDAASAITRNGGKVLEKGFNVLFAGTGQTEDSCSSASTRGSPRSSSAQTDRNQLGSAFEQPLQLKSSIADDVTAFLLADSHSRNTKYFQALALGIPCLSTRWIHICVEKQALVRWRHFVLAAGESAFLDGAIISRSLPVPLGTDVWSLKDMLASRITWLDGKRVLFVGADHKILDAHTFLVHALGVSDITAAADVQDVRQALKNRSKPARTESSGENKITDLVVFNYAGIYDSNRPASVQATKPAKRRKPSRQDTNLAEQGAALVSEFEGVRVVSTEFVMQSLILGRLLD